MADDDEVTEQLRAANPAREYEMGHERLAAMVSGAIGAPAKRYRRHRHARQRRVLSVAAMCAVVATGVLSTVHLFPADGRARPLPVLALGRVDTGAPKFSANGVPRTLLFSPVATRSATYSDAAVDSLLPSYRLGAAMTVASTAPVYEFSGTSDLQANVETIAQLLGMTTTPTRQFGCEWTVHSGAANLDTDCLSESTPPASWDYNNCPAAGGCPTDAGATTAQLIAWSQTLAGALAPDGLSLGTPRTDPTSDSIEYPCTLNGATVTGCGVILQFTSAGVVEFAQSQFGPTGPFVALNSYPLISVTAGVRRINHRTVTRATPTTPVTPLVAVHMTYVAELLTNGRWVLLPQFTYTTRSGQRVSTLAVSPRYIRAAPAT